MLKNDLKEGQEQKAPRLPTVEEIQQLEEFFCEEITWRAAIPIKTKRVEVAKIIASAYIAVFDLYIRHTITYAGKAMVVLYAKKPSYADVFIWGKKQQLIRTVHAT
jgi:hypothetical protein